MRIVRSDVEVFERPAAGPRDLWFVGGWVGGVGAWVAGGVVDLW